MTVQEKKEFVRWFLKRYKLKRRECVWILNYLLAHEALLENIHFVEEAHYAPRAMVITTMNSDSIPFRFYKGNLMTADAEKSFHDLRLHPEEKMYIQLNYRDKHSCPQYARVQEDNQYMPEDLKGLPKTERDEVRHFLDSLAEGQRKKALMDLIDKALDERDKDAFMQWTNELKHTTN